MKKISRLFLLTLILPLLVTMGCEKKDNTVIYDKEVNTYIVSKSNIEDKNLLFEYVKKDGLEINKKNGAIEIYNPNNLAKVTVYFYHEYTASNKVTRDKDDFFSASYKDFKKIKVGNYEGWSVFYKSELFTNYEASIQLSAEEDDKVYVAYIKVEQNPLQSDSMEFDTIKYVSSADFNHLLDSLKIIDKDN